MIDVVLCPKCKRRFLRTQSVIKHDSNNNVVGINYEWECYWCNYKEGDYSSVSEAKKDYIRKYGEENYGKQ